MMEQWLDRTWVLTWAGIVLATALLVAGKIEPGLWWSVFQLAAGGFYGLQLIQKIGSAVSESKGTTTRPQK